MKLSHAEVVPIFLSHFEVAQKCKLFLCILEENWERKLCFNFHTIVCIEMTDFVCEIAKVLHLLSFISKSILLERNFLELVIKRMDNSCFILNCI